MIELLGGIIIGGVAGAALKDKISGNGAQKEDKQKELNALYTENEKFSKRNKELERQVEDLLAELNKIRNFFALPHELTDYDTDFHYTLLLSKNDKEFVLS